MFMFFEHMHDAFPFVFFFGLSRLLWLALIILLVWSLVRMFRSRNIHWSQPMTPYTPNMPFPGHPLSTAPVTERKPNEPVYQPSALDILNRRYASGEIDETTFENMRERILATQKPEQQA